MSYEKGTLRHATSQLLALGTGADVTLVVTDGEFKVHSVILTNRSPVFAAMLAHGTHEAATGVIKIPDVEAAVMKHVLHYVYTDEVPDLTGMAAKLLIAAHKCGLSLLKKHCEDRLVGDLTMENAAECAVLAVQCCCLRLRAAAIRLMSRDPLEARRTEGWREAMSNCPLLMREISESVEIKFRKRTAKMLAAAERGNVAELQRILARGADINSRCEKGYTALHRAVKGGHTAAVTCLLEAGADVNATNNWGQTPLHIAAGFGNVCAVMTLLSLVADVDAKDRNGQTPLQIAAACGYAAAVSLLLRAGADPSVAYCCCGRTPLQLALAYNRKAVVKVLMRICPSCD